MQYQSPCSSSFFAISLELPSALQGDRLTKMSIVLVLLAVCLSASALHLSPVSRGPAAVSASPYSRLGALCMKDNGGGKGGGKGGGAPAASKGGSSTASDDPSAAGKVVISDATDKFKKSVTAAAESLSTLRVGKANPGLLDRVMVEYFGANTPLKQLASVTTPTPSQLLVDPCVARAAASNH